LYRANSDFECNRNQNIQFSSQDSDNQQQQQQQQQQPQPQPQPQPQQEQEQQDYNQQFSSSETTSQLHDPEYTAEDSFSKASFEIPIFHIPGVHNDLPLPSMIPGSSVLSDLKYPTISGSNSFVIPEDELYPIRSTQREEEASPTSEPVIQNKRRRTKRYSKISDDPQFKVPNEALVRSLREFIRMKNMKQRAVAHALSVRFQTEHTHTRTHYHRMNKLSHETIQSSNKYYFFNLILYFS
jgi:hypothetical protein